MSKGYQGIKYEPIISYVLVAQPVANSAEIRSTPVPQTFGSMLEFLCSIQEGAVIINPAREALVLRERARAMAPSKTEFDLLMAARDREMASRGQLF